MNTKFFLECTMFGQVFAAAAILAIMWRRRLLKSFFAVTAYLAVSVLQNCISIATLFFRKTMGLEPKTDYNIFFYSRWSAFFILSALTLVIIYSVFRYTMKPLEGLHRAGKVIFRWIFSASLLVSLAVVFSPHIGGSWYFQSLASQIQQSTSILTLCLLLFVCFATRYLGMTYRSHIFGISLGLGVMATVSLVESAFFTVADTQPLYSPVYVYSGAGAIVALLVWGTYFALPEPVAKMILLPTTSPYFTWNRISEALGDDPGQVAIAGFKPQMLAPAELAVLTAASRRVQEREAEEMSQPEPMQAFAVQR